MIQHAPGLKLRCSVVLGSACRMVVLCVAVCICSFSLRAHGPCDPPPYSPLEPVASGQAALDMDRWAVKTLRRDIKGRTCADVQELVDILLVRWLQAHPEITIALEGKKANALLQRPDQFLHRLKAEAWVASKGRRNWFPRRWGRKPHDPVAEVRRLALLEETLAALNRP